MNKKETHIVQGMTRDLSVHKFNPNMVVDARNIRITTLKNNSTLLSVTNEKGTKQFTLTAESTHHSVKGTIIGAASFVKTLVLFTVEGTVNRIYRIDFADDFASGTSTRLFEGPLQMDAQHPLETLPFYENEHIQKVYWVDGKNQPRMINIANGRQTDPDIFNFNREIDGKHEMKITKSNTGGEFPAGTVQYCFNYFNKFGQETNIVDTSALYYLSPKDKGLPADALSTCSFLIELSGLDYSYEYVRLYSIVRTSENAVPNVRIVGDYKIVAVYPIPPVGRIYEDAVISKENLYVVEGTTFTPKYSVYDKFGETIVTDVYSLNDNEFLCDIETGTIYLYEANYTELKQFCAGYSNGNYTLPYQGTMSASYLYSGQISNQIAQRLSIVDNGIIGSTIDASALLFIGGQDIVAGTLTTKDNTLFLGNIKQNVPNAGTIEVGSSTVKEAIKGTAEPCAYNEYGVEIQSGLRPTSDTSMYVSRMEFYDDPVDNNRPSYDVKSFKARENYRLGLIAQYKTGQWSEALWIDDLDETIAPGRNIFSSEWSESIQDYSTVWGPKYIDPGFKATLSADIVNALKEAGFIRVAPVVVYPKDADRKVLFQGLLFSTVFNVSDRADNSPFSQADWRARCGYNWNNILGEIQCNPFGYSNTLPKIPATLTRDQYIDKFSTDFYRDPSVLSFYSPDIEALDAMYQSDMEGLSMRIVGISNAGFDSEKHAVLPVNVIDTFLETSTQGFDPINSTVLDYTSGSPAGTRRGRAGQDSSIVTRLVTGDTDLSYSGFFDNSVTEDEDGNIVTDSRALFRWTTYLWHRNGSLNNQGALSAKAQKAGSIRYGMLGKKCISEIKYARTTFLQNDSSIQPFDVDVPINTPQLFDSDQIGMEKFCAGTDDGLFYYGNIDKVITANFNDLSGIAIDSSVEGRTTGYDMSDGYPIYSISQVLGGSSNYSSGGRRPRGGGGGSSRSWQSRQSDGRTDVAEGKGKDPVSMKYKTVKHLVIGLSSDTASIINQLGTTSSFAPYWRDDECTFNNILAGKLDNTIDTYSGIYDGVFVAELYRDFSDERLRVRFGGTSDSAIQNNIWTRCGDSVYLEEDEEAVLHFKEGDTYIGRYDCLKSYPYTDEDQNQIVSIYSTELESRVNLGARYDKNKGLSSNLYMRPTNFNLFNHPGYEQTNQYFTYKAIDYERYKSSIFPNMVTIGLEKKVGADIDAWTSVPMTATFDLQGDLGEITKLESFNDRIFAFQNKGISQILFNERVQIPTGDGQPIEITNGLKFGGTRYISNQIGMTNKWSLCTTPYGMYFIDDEKNTLFLFNGEQLSDLSTKAGFKTWLAEMNSYAVWNPEDYGNIRTFYDKLNGDIYFVSKDEALVYSESIGAFMSFMDYKSLPVMVNMNDKLFTFTKNEDTKIDTMWEMFAGRFNEFFGEFRYYWITFVANSDPTMDKVFNNLAWRTEDYSNVTDDFQGILEPMSTFDTVRVWNDHQDTGEVSLYDVKNKPSSLKKKFNVFRTQIPRDKFGFWKCKGLNRIRNTWAYVQLARKNLNYDFLMFHDLDVDFFE